MPFLINFIISVKSIYPIYVSASTSRWTTIWECTLLIFLSIIFFIESLLMDVIPFATCFLFLFSILTGWLAEKLPDTSIIPTSKREAPLFCIAKQAPSSKIISPTVSIACDNQLFLFPIGFSQGLKMVPIFLLLNTSIILISFLPSTNWTVTPVSYTHLTLPTIVGV